MADGFVGQAWVQIAPSFTGFQRAVGDELSRSLPKVGAQAGQDLGRGISDGVTRATNNGKGLVPTTGMENEAKTAGGRVATAIGNGLSRISAKGIEVVGDALVSVGRTAANVGGVLAVIGVGFGVAATRTAMRAGEMDAALGAIARASGISKSAMDAQIRTVRDTGITMDVAQGLVAQFARSNLDMARATDVARVAQDLAILTQQDSSETLNELLYGIQTGNTQLNVFRQLNINATDAQDKFAKQLGISRNDLTQTQKQQALMNAVIDAGIPIAGTYASAMEEPGKVLRSFPRLFDDAKLAIGQAFMPALQEIVKPLYDFTKLLAQSFEEGGKLRPIVDALRDAFNGLTAPLRGPDGLIAKLTEWFKALDTGAINRFADMFRDLAPLIPAVGAAIATFAGKNVAGGIPIIGDFVKGLNPLYSGLIGLALGFPPIRDALGQLMQKVMPLIPPLAALAFRLVDVLMRGVVPLIDPLLQLVEAVLEPLVDVIKILIPVLGFLLDAFGPILKIVVELVAAFIRFTAPVLKPLVVIIVALTAAWWLWNAALAVWAVLTSPITIVLIAIVAAIAAVIAIIAVVYRNWDTIWRAMLSVVQTVWGWIKDYWPLLLTILLGPVGLAISLIIKNFDTLKNAVITAWNAMADAIKWAWDNIIKPVFDIWTIAMKVLFAVTIAPILIAIYLAWQAMAFLIEQAWSKVIQPAWQALQTFLSAMWRTVIQPIINAWQAAWDALGNAIRWVWERIIQPAWALLRAYFQALYDQTIRPVIEGFRSAWEGLGNLIRWVWENVIRPAWDRLKEGLDSVRSAFQGAVRLITEAWNGLQEAVRKPVAWVVNTVVNPLIRGANKLLDLIGLGIPEITGFARGGLIPGGWGGGDTQLIMAEPGEWVLTKRQARAFGYSNLRALPHYQAGGEIPGGGDFHAIAPMFKPIDWLKKAGRGVLGGFEELLEMGKGALNSVTKLFRAAAAKAFEVGTLPLRKILEEADDINPPLFWTGAIARFGIRLIDAAIEFIKGKTEPEFALGGIGIDDLVGQILTQFPQLRVTSALRLGDPGYHGKGLARDLGGPVSVMAAAGRWIQDTLAGALLEGIHNPTLSVKNGKIVPASFWGAGTWAGHADHIHLASEAAAAFAGGDLGSWIAAAIAATGVSPAVWSSAIAYQIQRESGGNPRAINNWDINAQRGTPSKGLMQVIDPTFNAYRHPGLPNDIWAPVSNIAAAIRYIIGRYSASATSLGRWRPGGGYDEGGWLPPGVSLAVNSTGRPEPVLTPQQWDRIMQLAERPGTAGPVVQIDHAEFREETDIELLMRRAAWALETGSV